jgi:hypothetical protein
MIQETRDIRTLLAHQFDQEIPATPDPFGRSPATPRQISDVIHSPHELSRRELRRLEKRQRGQPQK